MGLSLLIFVTVTLGLIAGYQLLSGVLFPGPTQLQRRLAEEFGKGGPDAPHAPLFKRLDQLSVDLESGGMSDLGIAELPPPPTRGDWGFRYRLQALLEQANLPWAVWHFVAGAAGLGLALGALGFRLQGPWVGAPGAAAGVAALPLFVLFRRRARQQKFLTQLPAAFELMARVLRAGHSVPQALQAVVESSEQPLAGEFAQCQKQQNLGLRPEHAFQDLSRRVGIIELRIFIMAMLIQRQTGGNFSDVLERLAMLIRARLRLQDKVRTLTAEGRLQGTMLLVLPFVLFAALMVVNRSYAVSLFQHMPLLVLTGVSMLVGVVWIRSIINIEA